MPDEDVVIRAVGLGKSYTRYSSRWGMLLDRLQGTTKRGEAHWALRDVSFEVKRGEFFGVIGRNGAGKSTLLQLLAGVLQPTEGKLEVKGKVLALLELGASFDPLSTGRENCRVQMALFGVPSGEIEAKMKAVEEFAEIGPAFEEPVKTYSSGMFVRLAFAVNTVLEPDVLLVDEALAVGDVFFQQRCFEQLERLRSRGVTVVLVSHDLGLLAAQASIAAFLQEGHLRGFGPPVSTIDGYVDSAQRLGTKPAALVGNGDRGVSLEDCEVLDDRGLPCTSFVQGTHLTVRTKYASTVVVDRALPGFELEDRYGRRAHGRTSFHHAEESPVLTAGRSLRTTHRIRMDLAPGQYTLRVGLSSAPQRLLEQRPTLDSAAFWEEAQILHRSGRVAAIEVTLPDKRLPAREAYVGYAPLSATISMEVL